MLRRPRIPIAVAALLVLAALQAASDAIFSSAGQSASIPAHLPRRLGTTVYTALERLAPLPFVEAMLAHAALDSGEAAAAQTHVQRMPPSPLRSDLEAKIALARGDRHAAIANFLRAADVRVLQAEVDRLSALRRFRDAYDLENATREQLAASGTHPDLVADSYWRAGKLATALGYRAANAEARRGWFTIGLGDYRRALALAPFSSKYLIAAGSQNLNLGQYKVARAYFERSVEVDPASADAYAGLGIVALALGDRPSAESFAARSKALDQGSTMLQHLNRSLR